MSETILALKPGADVSAEREREREREREQTASFKNQGKLWAFQRKPRRKPEAGL